MCLVLVVTPIIGLHFSNKLFPRRHHNFHYLIIPTLPISWGFFSSTSLSCSSFCTSVISWVFFSDLFLFSPPLKCRDLTAICVDFFLPSSLSFSHPYQLLHPLLFLKSFHLLWIFILSFWVYLTLFSLLAISVHFAILHW